MKNTINNDSSTGIGIFSSLLLLLLLLLELDDDSDVSTSLFFAVSSSYVVSFFFVCLDFIEEMGGKNKMNIMQISNKPVTMNVVH